MWLPQYFTLANTRTLAPGISTSALLYEAALRMPGGNCGEGALSAAVGAAATPLVNVAFPNYKTDPAHFAGGTLATAAGGGKFENGAVTAAFGCLFIEVNGAYDRETGKVTVRDTDTGVEASGNFFSGGGFGDELPAGKYAILQRGQKDGLCLEAIDGNFGNDIHDASGRSLLRLHGPGGSIGCITACTASDWSPVQSIILNTNTSTTVVNTHMTWAPGGVKLFRFTTGVERIKNYGALEVK